MDIYSCTHINVSEYIDYMIVRDAVAFNPSSPTSRVNKNGFLNKLLPNIHEYKKEKKKYIETYVSENIFEKIPHVSMNSLVNCIDSIFQEIYFEDEISSNNISIPFRINSGNISSFRKIIKDSNNNFQKYARQLLMEYFSYNQLKREQLFFYKEFQEIINTLGTKKIIEFDFLKTHLSMLVFGIYPSANNIDSDINEETNYILGIDITNSNNLISIPLYKISNLSSDFSDISFDKSLAPYINDIIRTERYKFSIITKIKDN